jgi:hypothetical protein
MRHFPRDLATRRDSLANHADHVFDHGVPDPQTRIDRGARYARFTSVGAGGFSNNAVDAETITIGGQVYTFQNSLTQTNGHILIQAGSVAGTRNGLLAAMGALQVASSVASIDWAGNTVANSSVLGSSIGANSLGLLARIPGPYANSVALGTTCASFVWGNSFMSLGC